MLITTLDFPVERAAVTDARADRPDAVAGAELCVWCPDGLLEPLRAAGEIRDGRLVPGPVASQRLLALTRRLRSAFEDLLARGGSLVVLLGSATEGGVHTLQEVVDFDPLEAVPGPPMRTRALEAGWSRLDWERGQPFGDFFARHAHQLSPARGLHAPPGRTIARTAAGTALACFAYRHPGRLLVLPGPVAGLDPAGRGALLDGIRDLVRRLDPSRRAPALPPWAASLSLPGEPALRERAAALAKAEIEARRALEQTRAALARLDDARLLAAGDADAAAATLATLVVSLGGVPHPEIDLPRALAFELDGRAALLAIAAPEDADAEALAARLRASARHASIELDQPVAPILVDGSQNDRDPVRRVALADPVAHAARLAGATPVSSLELLHAWAARDPATLACWIDAALPAQREG